MGQTKCRGETGDPGPHHDDIGLKRGLKHVPLLEVARPVERSCPQPAPGIPEFGSRLGRGSVKDSRASTGHGRTVVAYGRPARTHLAARIAASIVGNANRNPDSDNRFGSTR